MTAMMRQIRKQILTMVAGLVAGMLLFASPALAQPRVRAIVSDPLTGVALAGFDPVSYFTDGTPRRGRPDFDFYWQGMPWYFASAANRDVFMRAPDIYAPQFGGHGTMSLARGYLTDGNPQLFVRRNVKLYFFYSAANREAFLLAPDAAITRAEAVWAGLAGAASAPPPERHAEQSPAVPPIPGLTAIAH